MNRLIVAITVALAAAMTFAAGNQPTPKLTKAEKEHLRLVKTGGMITRQGEGKAVIVNCQRKFPAAALSATIEPFKELLKVEMEVRDGSWKFGDGVPADANVAVYVVDDPKMPLSLIAPETRWGVVNVAQIDKESNLKKEVTRVAIMTFGAGVSQYKVSPMQPITSVKDLDSLVGSTLTVDVTMAMRANLEKLGLTQTKYTTYRKACMEGWAPQPTNEYQKAIWEQIHAIPDKPIKIEFDPKKDK